MKPVAPEVAQIDINDWLDFKKIGDKKREDKQDSIDALVSAVTDGSLVLDRNDFSLVLELKFPLGEDKKIVNLVFKPRVNIGTVKLHMQGLKGNDADGRLAAFIGALTGNTKGVINEMDTEDYSVAQSIVIFFI